MEYKYKSMFFLFFTCNSCNLGLWLQGLSVSGAELEQLQQDLQGLRPDITEEFRRAPTEESQVHQEYYRVNPTNTV